MPNGSSKEIPSYSEWLHMHGVIGRCENTEVILDEKLAVVNYLFKEDKQAKDFLTQYLEGKSIHSDSFSKRTAIIVDAEMHGKLQEAYKKYVETHYPPRSEAEIKAQLSLVEDCLKFSQRREPELKKLSSLASGKDSGWFASDAIDNYRQSLANYIAIHQDTLNTKEINSLRGMLTVLEHLKEDEKNKFEVATLLDGGKNKSSSHEVQRFLPDANGKSGTDAIYLNAGGMQEHYAVCKIWKRGYDKAGQEASEGVDHYKYYYTSYNAGLGAEWASEPFVNPSTKKKSSGVIWAASTHEISPINGPEPVDQRMRASIEEIITREHKLKMQERSAVKSPEFKLSDPKILSERINFLSTKGLPQTSGNCSVMSLKVVLDSIASNLSEEHWLYVKGIAAHPTQALLDKKTALEKELQSLSLKTAHELPPKTDYLLDCRVLLDKIITSKEDKNDLIKQLSDLLKGAKAEGLETLVKTLAVTNQNGQTTLDFIVQQDAKKESQTGLLTYLSNEIDNSPSGIKLQASIVESILTAIGKFNTPAAVKEIYSAHLNEMIQKAKGEVRDELAATFFNPSLRMGSGMHILIRHAPQISMQLMLSCTNEEKLANSMVTALLLKNESRSSGFKLLSDLINKSPDAKLILEGFSNLISKSSGEVFLKLVEELARGPWLVHMAQKAPELLLELTKRRDDPAVGDTINKELAEFLDTKVTGRTHRDRLQKEGLQGKAAATQFLELWDKKTLVQEANTNKATKQAAEEIKLPAKILAPPRTIMAPNIIKAPPIARAPSTLPKPPPRSGETVIISPKTTITSIANGLSSPVPIKTGEEETKSHNTPRK